MTADDICMAVRDAVASGEKIEIRGGGSKAQIGAPYRNATILSMSSFSNVIDYDPPELVLTAGAGTPLKLIEELVADAGQMLAFEPFDHGPIFGKPAGAATLGGVIAAGVSGPRRLSMGAARDHLLGFEAVSGHGERFVGGAKVVKNVTGFDLPKIMTGSWGRLAVLTQVTLKVLPRAQISQTILLKGLPDRSAYEAMTLAMRSPAEVLSAAHLPAEVNDGLALTAIRIHGFGPSVAARNIMLRQLLQKFGFLDQLTGEEEKAIWNSIRDVVPLAGASTLWRINIPPSSCCAVIETLARHGAGWFMDWAGGLIWTNFEGEAHVMRAAAEMAGGHCMLVRGDAESRARVPAQHPETSGVAALSRRVREAFDPSGVFETGRFMDVNHAN